MHAFILREQARWVVEIRSPNGKIAGFNNFAEANGSGTIHSMRFLVNIFKNGWDRPEMSDSVTAVKPYLSPRRFLRFIVVGLVLCETTIESSNAQSFDPVEGLIAYWPLNGNAVDESGNGNHGTVNGPVPTEDRFGKQDGAMLFDGVDDFIDIGVGVKPPLPITVMAWIKPSLLTGRRGLLRNDYAAGQGTRAGVSVLFDEVALGTSAVGSAVWNGNANLGARSRRHVWTAAAVVTVSDWQHVAVVITGVVDRQVFLNGTEVPLGDFVGEGTQMTYSAEPGAIGHVFDGSDSFFAGAIEEARVYSKALTQEQIRIAGDLASFESLLAKITRPPQHQQVPVGGTAQFTVVAEGEAPLSYQWLFNGAPLSGETRAELVLADVRARDSGEYSVRISNRLNTLTSGPARLDVLLFEISAFHAMEIEFPSSVGKNYRIQGSADLKDWQLIETVLGTGQLVQRFIRTRGTAFRFIRVEEAE